jgi:hypothetical protein
LLRKEAVMAKKTNGNGKRKLICFVPGCREERTREEAICPRHIRHFEALRAKKKSA